ncbi:MAG TPA: hypothetical protein VID48_11025 [Solirubrobacteraceae bacterium]
MRKHALGRVALPVKKKDTSPGLEILDGERGYDLRLPDARGACKKGMAESADDWLRERAVTPRPVRDG